jgi:hypothetical protein
MKKVTLVSSCILAFSLLTVSGTIFRALSGDELTARADLVVHGTVRSKTCQRDEAGRIFTRIQLDVIEVWKGSPRTELVIFHGGGILGQQKTVVSGQAQFELNEEVVVFAALNPRGQAVSLGLAQGKFHVSSREGKKMADNGISAPLSGGPAPATMARTSTGPATGVSLADLKQTVRAHAQAAP